MQEETINLDDLEDICEEAAIAEPFIEDSALIKCGRLLCQRALLNSQDRITSGNGEMIVSDITSVQKDYLNTIADGTSSKDACEKLGIDSFLPTLWNHSEDKDGLYIQCYNMIMEKHAKELEEVIRKEAIGSSKSALLKMFYMKAWDDKYKDNAAPQSSVQTLIQVTISDQNGNARPYTVNTAPIITEDTACGN